MPESWSCPRCQRRFSRKSQRHACGTGDRHDVLKNRPDEVVQLYVGIEKFVLALGKIEIVARERYVLFRSVRIFADLVIMSDAVRVAVHLASKVEHPLFFKVVSGERFVSHVAKVRTKEQLEAIEPYLEAAYRASLAERTPNKSRAPRSLKDTR
jgi:hypothetical protein